MSKLKWFFSMLIVSVVAMNWQSCKDSEDLDDLPVKTDSSVNILFSAKFDDQFMDFDNGSYKTLAGDTLTFSKMKMLFSNFLFKKEDGSYDTMKDVFGYIDLVGAERNVKIPLLEPGMYKGLRFFVGLDSAVNFADANAWGPSHPLNPLNNFMHWSWAGGYQFNSIEGSFKNNGVDDAFSFHFATLKYTKQYEFAFDFDHKGEETIHFDINAEQYFKDPYTYSLKLDGKASHSSDTLPIMDNLLKNVHNLFEFEKVE